MASLPAMCMSHVAGFHQQFHLFLAEAQLHSPECHGGVAGAPNMLLTLCEVVLAGNLLEKGDSMEEQPTKPWDRAPTRAGINKPCGLGQAVCARLPLVAFAVNLRSSASLPESPTHWSWKLLSTPVPADCNTGLFFRHELAALEETK